MPVFIHTNMPQIKIKIEDAWKKNLYPLSEQILTDCNNFVRVDTGVMESTSYTASDFEKGELVWDTPYAKMVYYTGHPSHDQNPNASLQWCEKAAGLYGNDWQALANKLFSGDKWDRPDLGSVGSTVGNAVGDVFDGGVDV